MPRWRQINGELVLIDAGHGGRSPRAPAVQGDIEPFTSPIDGRVIGSRRDLREHNREHGVVNVAEYGEEGGREFFERAQAERTARATGQTERDRRERLEAIIPIVERNERR